VPGLEVEYAQFLNRVAEETCDPEWNIQHHPARNLLERFPPLFEQWVAWLHELFWLRDLGYPLKTSHLSLLQWKCLAVLKQWQKQQLQAAERSRLPGPFL
jgi:hypothetical protein